MLTRDLKKSSDNLVVNGKLIINLSTNLDGPPRGNLNPSSANASRPSLHSAQGSTASSFTTQNVAPAAPLQAAGPSQIPVANGNVPNGATSIHAPTAVHPSSTAGQPNGTAPLSNRPGGTFSLSKMHKVDYLLGGSDVKIIWGEHTMWITTPGRQAGIDHLRQAQSILKRQLSARDIRIELCQKIEPEPIHRTYSSNSSKAARMPTLPQCLQPVQLRQVQESYHHCGR